MIDKFIFPVNFNDVQKESEIHSFQTLSVNLNIQEKQIIRHLNQIDKILFQNFSLIAENQYFDYLYFLIKGFGESIEFKSMRVIQKLADTIHLITKNMLKQAEKAASYPEDHIFDLRNSLKMTLFLTIYFIVTTTLRKAKYQADLIGDALNKDKKKKNRTESTQLSQLAIDRQRLIINLLKECLFINYQIIWQKKEVDGQFFKKFCDVAVKILESNLVKDQNTLETIFQIIQNIIKVQPQLFKNIQIVLINLVYQSQIVDNLVNFFSNAQSTEVQKLCTQTIILVVIYLSQKTNLNAEASSIKNTKEFLSKLSQRIPKVFYTNLSCFIRLYENQSYYLRNAISDILMNIIKNVLSNESQQNNRSKQKFITTLLQRIYDKNAFCRSYILNILGQLTSQKMIPRKFMILFMKAGIDRVKDNSINVRRKAIQLINIIIDQICKDNMKPLNQIQKQLQLCELTLKTLNEEQDKLRKQIDHLDDEQRVQQLIGQMKLIKKSIKQEEQKQIDLLEEKQIINLVQIVVKNTKILLGSKSESDVLQTIRLFVKLYKLSFEGSKDALPHIRLLIFSREKKIKDQVLTTFIHLHLNKKSQDVAKQLVELFTHAITSNAQDLSSLEQILEIIITQSLQKNYVVIKPHAYAHMWNQFIQYERSQTNIQEKRAILTILRSAFTKDPTLIKQENMESFLNILKKYIQTGDPDFYLMKEISKIITLQHEKVVKVSKNFLIAQIFILINCQGTSDNQWYSSCENVLTCIFKVCQSPQKLSQLLIKKLHQNLQKNKTQKALSQFIFTLSHSCLKTLIHLDVIQNKIKSIKQTQISKQEDAEQELDKVMGGAQAQLQKKIQQIQLLAQRILEDPFIKRWIQIIEDIVKKFKNGNQLQVIAVLSYCKFMCLSASYCQKKIQPVLDLLIKPGINSVVKNNIIIAIGDLLHRFPNIVEPYNQYLYRNLHDKDVRVRKTTLTVLTHLSLNDMIKVKSDLCDIALLFQDPNAEIQSLVKQFFNQLNKKDPKIIFNLIPDALAKFSNNDRFENQNVFNAFLENIIPLLQKDKFSESLVIKLCERLSNSLNLLEIKNTAHCLSQININQKGLRKILQSFQSIRKTIQTPQVANSFRNLISKLKKNQKAQFKPLIQELQQKVNNAGEQSYNAEQVRRRNQEKLMKKKQLKKQSKNLVNSQRKQANRSQRKNRMQLQDENDEEQQNSQSSSSSGNDRRKNTGKKTETIAKSRPQRNKGKMNIIVQEDDEDMQIQDEDEYGDEDS